MSRKHVLLMIAGCVLPMVAVAAVFIFKVQVNTIILAAVLLLCPLMHLWMFKEHAAHGHHGQEKATSTDRTPITTTELSTHTHKEQ